MKYKVLISAYACEPDSGSESQIGWYFVNEIAKKNDVWVITRLSNKEAIESKLGATQERGINWLFFDLPWILRFWKKGRRGLRLYYFLWQFAIFFKIMNINRKVKFDIIHHITFANYWLPSFLPHLSVPFIWGPVGGGESISYNFYKRFPIKYKIYEFLRNCGQFIHDLNPILKVNAQETALALAANFETGKKMNKIGYKNIEILSQVAIDENQFIVLNKLTKLENKKSDCIRFFTVARLLPLKGIDLAIHAFYQLSKRIEKIEYIIIGSGEYERLLRKKVRNLNLDDKIKFLGFKTQMEVFELIGSFDIFLFPSFHDSGGLAVTEAMAAGKPVICLDIGGPAVQVNENTGIKISLTSNEQIIKGIEDAMFHLCNDEKLRFSMGQAGKKRVMENFTWRIKGNIVQKYYDQIYKQRNCMSQ